MSTIAASSPVASNSKRKSHFTAKLIASAAILTVAGLFVLKYALRYYLNYNAAAFADQGAPNYWSLRGWLMMHITGGMTALLTGPFQFWTGFRLRYARLHRWMGRIFLCGVAVGSIGAFRMAIGTTGGWPFGFSLLALDTAWFTSAAMAYYAIMKRRIPIHKEWMVRTYVVTFAFVFQRVLFDYFPGSRLQPDLDRGTSAMWTSWALPLLFTELILQLRRMRSMSPTR